MTEDQALAIVFSALENLNEELEDDSKIEISPDTPLFGTNAVIDSLSLVSLIVDIEQAASAEAEKPISLTDEQAINKTPSPFTSPSALAEYLVTVTDPASGTGHAGP